MFAHTAGTLVPALSVSGRIHVAQQDRFILLAPQFEERDQDVRSDHVVFNVSARTAMS